MNLGVPPSLVPLRSYLKVKRYRAKKGLHDADPEKERWLWRENDILIQVQPLSEYYRPSTKIPDPENEQEHCLGFPLHYDLERWDEYYEELRPIFFKDSPTFNFFKVRCGMKIKRLEEKVEPLLARIKELKEWYESADK